MIEHLVLFRWRRQASLSEIQAVLHAMLKLKEKIPGIADLTCGETISSMPQGFKHGLRICFESREALASYESHPIHQSLVTQLQPLLADILIFDYEWANLIPNSTSGGRG